MDADKPAAPCCGGKKKRIDLLFWGALTAVALGLALSFLPGFGALPAVLAEPLHHYAMGIRDILAQMWWGLALGILFVGLLSHTPRTLVTAILGRGGSLSGVVRATLAGLTFDLCNHGILLVAMQLYKRGASLGQVMAFLIASPWNSMSLTLMLWALVGWKWTTVIILGSAAIAIVSGLVFEMLVRRGTLPENPNTAPPADDWKLELLGALALAAVRGRQAGAWGRLVRDGIAESRMVLRWVFLGLALAAAVRALMPMDDFAHWFGPTALGLLLTLFAATVIEVCSEGSTPLAADLLTRAAAPGNAFAFLMAGAATDYTEIMALRETTGSWKISLFLPLVSLPQVLLLSWLMNVLGSP